MAASQPDRGVRCLCPCQRLFREFATPLLFLPGPSVTFAVTTDAKRNQVVHHIATELAPAFYVMDFQAFHGTALLARPTISFEHACPHDCVLFRIQFESRSFLA